MNVKIPRLYSGDDGKSHWGELEVELKDMKGWAVPGTGRTDDIPATAIRFRLAPPGTDTGWVNAPARQFVFTITGEVEYEIDDGKPPRRFGPGGIFLAEDFTGKGHISRGIGPGTRLSAYVHAPKVK